MKREFQHLSKILFTLCCVGNILVAQNKSQDVISTDIYKQATENVSKRKAFQREKWFYEQRAYPDGIIPAGARASAMAQKNQMKNVLYKGGTQNKLFSYSDWHLIGPAPGKYTAWGAISGRLPAIAIDQKNPSRIFVGGATGGIWRTTDKAATWTSLSDHEASLATGSIAIDPTNSDIIYAGTGEATYSLSSYYGAGLLKSVDGGDSWTNISNGIPMGGVTSRILVSSKNPSIVIAALAGRGIYRSEDAGNNWSRVFAKRVDDIVINSQNNDMLFGIGGDGTGLIRSIDEGRTWTAFGDTSLPRQSGRMQIDICRDQPTILYAATYSEPNFDGKVQVYKTTNTGSTWTKLAPKTDFAGGQAWYDFYVRTSPTNPLVCFVGTIEIFRTSDGGTTWTNVSKGYSGGPVHVDEHELRFASDDPKTIYAGNDGGLYKSTDLGETWISLNSGLVLTQFYRIASDYFNADHILGGTQDNGTQQTFGQVAWTDAFGGDGGEVCFSRTTSQIFLGESQNGGLNRTTNGGYMWEAATDGFLSKEPAAWVAPIVAHPKGGQIFYHGRVNLYKTINGGKNWEMLADSVFGTEVINNIAISNNPDQPLLYMTQGNKVMKSIDDGMTFTSITASLPNRTITSIYTHPNKDSGDVVFVTLSGFGGDKVWRTNYQNTNWISISGNLPDTPINDIFINPDAPDKLFFVATDIGVFVTENGGQTWAELSTGLPNTVAMHLDYNALTKKLRVATHGRSVWEITITPVPVEPPRNLIASAEYRMVTVSWDPSISANIKNYSVYRGTKTGIGDHIANIGTNTAFINNGLENDRTYYYRVRAVTATDSSVLSAEVSGTPRIWQGCLNQVAILNGFGNHIVVPPTINSFNALTVEGWVWWKAFNSWSRFIDFGQQDHSFLIANEGTTNTLQFQIYGPSGVNSIVVSQALSKDRPVQIAAVSGPNGMKLYLNGQLMDSNPYTGSIGQTGATKIANYIGRSNWSTDRNLNGEVDEVRIWKVERTAQQIQKDFNRTLTPAELADTNLVAYYNFENYDDTTAFDATKYKNNAKLKQQTQIAECDAPVFVAEENVKPLTFELRQNHPNPFTQTTSISFVLDRRTDVTLEVYNSLGKKIATLVNNESMDPGLYTEGFDATQLPSGVYMYVLRAGDRIVTKKMTLVR